MPSMIWPQSFSFCAIEGILCSRHTMGQDSIALKLDMDFNFNFFFLILISYGIFHV